MASLLYCGFAPRTAARVNLASSWGGAYLLHWAGMVLLGLAVLASLLLLDDPSDPVGQLFREWRRGDLPLIAATLAVVGAIELAHLLLGAVLFGVAAHDEPLGETYRHAQRTAWIHTCQAAWAILIGSLFTFWVDAALWPYRSAWYVYNRYQGGQKHTLLVWLAGHQDFIIVLIIAAAAGWVVWGLFRAGTLARPVPLRDHPLICEYCGYDVRHLEPHGRCPECGTGLQLSLGDHRRPTAWTSGRGFRVGAWSACAWRAWFKPERFFRTLHTAGGQASAVGFLVFSSVVSAVATWVGAVGSMFVVEREEFFESDFLLFTWFPAMLLASSQLGFVCFLGAVIGVVVSRQERRNRAGAAFQVASYCAGLLPIWAFVSSAFIVAAMSLLSEMRLYRYYNYATVGWFGLHALFLVLYVGGAARRMKFVRYANR